jgi:hypothetical protein
MARQMALDTILKAEFQTWNSASRINSFKEDWSGQEILFNTTLELLPIIQRYT